MTVIVVSLLMYSLSVAGLLLEDPQAVVGCAQAWFADSKDSAPSDRRRHDCWATSFESPRRCIELSDAELEALDDIDRRARAEVRRAGHTHAVASGVCVRADARHLGRTRARERPIGDHS